MTLDQRSMADDRRHGARPNREVRKIRFDLVSTQRLLNQSSQRLLHERAAILPGDHERALDLARGNQSGGHGERIQETETRIGHVENLGRGREADLAMRERRGGGFEHVTAHRGMDEQLNLRGRET